MPTTATERLAAAIAEAHPREDSPLAIAEELMEAVFKRNLSWGAALAYIGEVPRQSLSVPDFLRWCDRYDITAVEPPAPTKGEDEIPKRSTT